MAIESFGLNLSGTNSALRSSDADALAREILQHKEEDKNKSYLGRLISGLTESFHGSDKSLEHMDALMQSAMLAQMGADTQRLSEAQKEMRSAVAQDIEARKSANAWTSHTSGFVKSLGLFFPGKAGYALSALTNAADSAHQNDSLGRQGADLTLGAGKGLALKWGFDRVGQSEMNFALKAGTLSISNRFAELGLDSHTYFDKKTGALDIGSGLWKTATTMADPYQLGNDMLTFGTGYFALKKLGLSPEFAKENPLLAQAITGGGFGFSSGFFSDLQMQRKLGEGVNLGSALKSAFIQMSLDGTAAAIGGARMQQMRSLESQTSALEAPSQLKPARTPLNMDQISGIYGLDNRPVARHHAVDLSSGSAGGLETSSMTLTQIPSPRVAAGLMNSPEIGAIKGNAQIDLQVTKLPSEPVDRSGLLIEPGKDSSSKTAAQVREFVSLEDVSKLIPQLREKLLDGTAMFRVREKLSASDSSSALGPEKMLLVRHLEPGTKVTAEQLAGADLLATCNPELLKSMGLGDLAQRHLFPDAGSSKIILQVPGSNRLRFSLPEAVKSGVPALELSRPRIIAPEDGMTVSEWLRSLDKNDRMANLHDLATVARAMDHFKVPMERFLGGGNETMAFRMKDGSLLRVTDKPFLPEWGTRNMIIDGREVRFDASIIGPRKFVNVGDTVVNYYRQQEGKVMVRLDDLHYFEDLIEKDGRYVFWDNDGGAWGQSQLAYVPLWQDGMGRYNAIPVSGGRAGAPDRGLVLIDYDAVRKAGTEPKRSGADERSWRYGNYDFEPFDR